MRFKVDENLPAEAVHVLRRAGHDAVMVLDEHLDGKPDAEIACACRREGRALVTLDADFGDIRLYPPKQLPGLVVLRLRRQDRPHVLRTLERLTQMLTTEPLAGHLWIVDEQHVRIRG